MKKLLLFLLFISCLFFSNTNYTQISYNGVILNTDESLLKDESVTLRIKIRENSPSGNSIFEEEHTTTTNKYGIFYISIGEGNGNDDFNTINWGKGEYYVETALKTNADSSFRVLGVTKLAYAPLALYAKNAGVFKTENEVTSNANGNIGADNFVFGSRQLDDSGNTAEDIRMFFDKRKGAFRAGKTTSTQWNAANVGISSTALGFNTTASGDYSTALGLGTTASGNISTALGLGTTARSGYETTVGRWNTDYTPNKITGWNIEDRLFVIGNGFSSASRSDALIVYKDGDATLKGQLTLSNGSSSYTLPNSDGTDGQVITTDGRGNAIWQAGSFTNNNNIINGGDDNDDFVFGSSQLDDSGNVKEDSRMFFDKSKGAFRAGKTTSTQWDVSNVGDYSSAMGFNTTASGNYSTAIGVTTTASGRFSTALGSNTTAPGNWSTALGSNTTASGVASIAMGAHTTASGPWSMALGHFTTAKSSFETTVGRYNTDYTPIDDNNWSAVDRLFVIGNGTSSTNRSDALIIYKDGDATLKGKLRLTDGSSSYHLPNIDGTNGQVLTTNGRGRAIWQTPLGAFTTNNNIISGGDKNDDFVFGSSQLDDSGNFDEENRMYFSKSLAAFRAGKTTSTQWNVDNVGWLSTAFGFDTTASGIASTAMGTHTKASGYGSTAIGRNTTAKSGYEITVGSNNTDYNPNDVNGWNAADRLFVIGNGSISTTKSDALIMLKNGNTELNGTFTIDASNDDTGYTLPTKKGTENQVLTANANGTTSWKTFNNDIQGPKGDKGDTGDDGKSTYQIWLDNGNTGTQSDFIISLKGVKGDIGDKGDAGKSAYQIWLDNGNTGTRSDFIASLKGVKGDIGDKGDDGKSAYQIWLDAGNTGSESDFVAALKGDKGVKGDKGDSGQDGTFQINLGVVSNVNGNIATDDFVFGSLQLNDDVSTTNDDNRFFFDKSKGAFRVGTSSSDFWDESNIGNHSFATGRGTQASGDESFASGYFSRAIGGSSTAIGSRASALGGESIALGSFSVAEAIGSIAIGKNINSQSAYQITLGLFNKGLGGSTTEWFETDPLFIIANGLPEKKSNALVMLKNGNTELNGALTIDVANDDTGYTLPTQKGTENQVLTANADGTTSWKDAVSGGVFQKSNQVITNVSSTSNIEEDFVFGSTELDYTFTLGTLQSPVRMFFDKSKGAFRAGASGIGNDWNEALVGNYSFATGNTTRASGENSFASGLRTRATGRSSIAMGSNAEATELVSIAIGDFAKANGAHSSAIGSAITANSFAQTTIGYFNTDRTGDKENFISTDPLFVIGNGTFSQKKDALVMLKNGNTELNGTFTIDANNNDSGYTLPTQKGTENQVLTANADGTTSWKNVSTQGNNSQTYTVGFNASLGGYVAYVTPNGKHGIVVSMVEQSSSSGNQTTTWSNAFNRISIPNYFDTNGQNFTDWRLPTSYELANYILKNATILNINSGDYWTNTESSTSVSKAISHNISNTVTIQGVVTFLPSDKDKQTLAKVRAVRSF